MELTISIFYFDATPEALLLLGSLSTVPWGEKMKAEHDQIFENKNMNHLHHSWHIGGRILPEVLFGFYPCDIHDFLWRN